MPTSDPLIINLSDALRHPQFNANLRDLVLAISERGGDVTIAEIAEVVGLDPVELARQIMAETISAEVLRILNLEEDQRRRAN